MFLTLSQETLGSFLSGKTFYSFIKSVGIVCNGHFNLGLSFQVFFCSEIGVEWRRVMSNSTMWLGLFEKKLTILYLIAARHC